MGVNPESGGELTEASSSLFAPFLLSTVNTQRRGNEVFSYQTTNLTSSGM